MEQDVLMAYINDLGYIADTTTKTLSHARKPLKQSQETDPHDRKKPNVEPKFDTRIRMDVITTEDIIASDRDDSVMQKIERRLSLNEPNTLQQTMSSRGWSTKTLHLAKGPSPNYVSSRSTFKRNNDPPGLTQSS